MQALRVHLLGKGLPVAALTAPRGRVVYTLLGILLSAVVARVSWVMIEQPFLRLKRLFPYDRPMAPKRAESGASLAPD